ncbi:hypothetical protein [Chryseobacterium aquaeductus]|uniref:hypothetical protein n=1 Tax=Chryseobacterium aquaeductus TaxID=2675056 RepID=UPI001E2ECB02|nr:hypothetical protein [Chryseobacterium aquaeductus]
MLTHKHKIDNNPEEILAQNTYNELSQLQNKKVGGAILGSGLQSIDYAYNIRGWMTHINDPNDLNGKLFGYEIKYTNPENTSLSTPRFNGNIAEVDWVKIILNRTLHLEDTVTNMISSTGFRKRYFLNPTPHFLLTINMTSS